MSALYLSCAIILLIALARMVYTDMKMRYAETVSLIIFAVSLMSFAVMKYGLMGAGINFIFNIVLLAIMSGSVYVYFRFAKGVKPSEYAGLGDVLFIAALAAYFEVRGYVWFLVISFIISLLWWVGSRFRKAAHPTIPLVSTVGICFGIEFIYSHFALWIF